MPVHECILPLGFPVPKPGPAVSLLDQWVLRRRGRTGRHEDTCVFCRVSGILSPWVMHILQRRSQAWRPQTCPKALFGFHESHIICFFSMPFSTAPLQMGTDPNAKVNATNHTDPSGLVCSMLMIPIPAGFERGGLGWDDFCVMMPNQGWREPLKDEVMTSLSPLTGI